MLQGAKHSPFALVDGLGFLDTKGNALQITYTPPLGVDSPEGATDVVFSVSATRAK